MFYLCILIYSTRAIEWWILVYILRTFTRLVWPVGDIGLTGLLQTAIFWCKHMPPYFMAKLSCHKTFSIVNIAQGRWWTICSAIYFSKGDNMLSAINLIGSSWNWINLLWPPLLPDLCWLGWLLFNWSLYCLFLAHSLQSSLLGVR